MEPNNVDSKDGEQSKSESCSGTSFFSIVCWWAMLVAAVIAIPTGGAAIAMMLPFGGLGQLIAFVIGCWICTWVGMWLMQHSDKFEKK